jgi:polyisoprenoid-binding protein YceI
LLPQVVSAIIGTLMLDAAMSQVQIDTSSLRVIDFPLTWLARSREFLDTSRFPIASFVSSDLQFDGGVPTTITGALTIKGITRRKRFEVKKIELEQTTSETKARLSVEASRRLSRSHFDIRGLPGLVDDLVQVELLLSAQAVS